MLRSIRRAHLNNLSHEVYRNRCFQLPARIGSNETVQILHFAFHARYLRSMLRHCSMFRDKDAMDEGMIAT